MEIRLRALLAVVHIDGGGAQIIVAFDIILLVADVLKLNFVSWALRFGFSLWVVAVEGVLLSDDDVALFGLSDLFTEL
jgi:hypothetical protein